MKFNVFFAFVLLAFLGCKNDGSNNSSAISQLEQAAEANPDKESALKLIDAYRKTVAENPENGVENASLLYRAAGAYYKLDQYENAAAMLVQSLMHSEKAPTAGQAIHLLGDLYSENLNMKSLGQDLYQSIMVNHPTYASVDKIKPKIRNTDIPLNVRIDEMAMSMYDTTTHKMNFAVAKNYITSCEVYAIANPNNTNAANLLFKAAETAKSVRNFQKALSIYDWIYNKFTGHEKSHQALFLKAFILDNELKKHDEARVLYQAFLDKYPNDDFADDSKFLLENLGKSDDEIIKNFGNQ